MSRDYKNLFCNTVGVAPHRNEEGFILILSLAALIVLSVLSVAGVRNSSIELQIAGNERVAAVNFYNAEGASYEGAQKVMDEDDTETLLPASSDTPLTGPTALIKTADEEEEPELVDDANLDLDGDGEFDQDDLDDIATASVEAVADSDVVIKSLVTVNNIPSGSSLALGGSRLYDYSAYGYGESNGYAVVKVGVKKRF